MENITEVKTKHIVTILLVVVVVEVKYWSYKQRHKPHDVATCWPSGVIDKEGWLCHFFARLFVVIMCIYVCRYQRLTIHPHPSLCGYLSFLVPLLYHTCLGLLPFSALFLLCFWPWIASVSPLSNTFFDDQAHLFPVIYSNLSINITKVQNVFAGGIWFFNTGGLLTQALLFGWSCH